MARKRKPGRPRGSRNRRPIEEEDELFEETILSSESKRGIGIIFLLTAAVICALSLLDLAGTVGVAVSAGLTQLLGRGVWLFPVLLLLNAYWLVAPLRTGRGLRVLGMFILLLAFNGLLHLAVPLAQAKTAIALGHGGGYVGLALSWPLQTLMGFWATAVVLIALLGVGLLVTFDTSLVTGIAKLVSAPRLIRERLFGERTEGDEEPDYFEDEPAAEEEELSDDAEAAGEEPDVDAAAQSGRVFAAKPIAATPPHRRYKKIDIPLDLLADPTEKPTAGDVRANQERIRKTLETFGIPVEMRDVSVGPTVTQYTLKPTEGVKLSQITTLHNDLALALAAHPIRIEAPIPGRDLVGIEVPNQSIATVTMKEVLVSKEFTKRKTTLTLGLGKDVSGTAWTSDLTTMPHLLIAGSTGSGKTVCVNSILVSLLYQNSPNTLRLILVDPKRVELPVYNGIPHLLTPVITDVKRTINALRWAITEMDRRFEVLAKTGHRDIHSYNRASSEKMPFLVLVIDELADLMQTSGAEVEGYIIRLAQLARATGIHLILATQRPSVDVITGLIKANITSRVAFAVASGTDSRTILDFAGAEKLLGRGDMLFLTASLSTPKRLQGCFVSDDEIRRIVEYIKGQNGEPDYDASITEKQAGGGGGGGGFDDDGDELLEEAKELVVRAGKASASYLQRRLKIGYARAARLLDLLEEQGVIGPGEGAKPREILIDPSELGMAPVSRRARGEEDYTNEEPGEGVVFRSSVVADSGGEDEADDEEVPFGGDENEEREADEVEDEVEAEPEEEEEGEVNDEDELDERAADAESSDRPRGSGRRNATPDVDEQEFI